MVLARCDDVVDMHVQVESAVEVDIEEARARLMLEGHAGVADIQLALLGAVLDDRVEVVKTGYL